MRGRAATAVSLSVALMLGGCLYPEPVTEAPPPSNLDSAPAILSVEPTNADLPSTAINGACVLSGIKLTKVSSPKAQPLVAQLYLNLDPTNPVELSIGGQTNFALKPTDPEDPTIYGYDFDTIDLATWLSQLNSLGSSQNNILTVFVSDGFASPSTYAAKAGFYTTLTFWQLDFTACDPRLPATTL